MKCVSGDKRQGPILAEDAAIRPHRRTLGGGVDWERKRKRDLEEESVKSKKFSPPPWLRRSVARKGESERAGYGYSERIYPQTDRQTDQSNVRPLQDQFAIGLHISIP